MKRDIVAKCMMDTAEYRLPMVDVVYVQYEPGYFNRSRTSGEQLAMGRYWEVDGSICSEVLDKGYLYSEIPEHDSELWIKLPEVIYSWHTSGELRKMLAPILALTEYQMLPDLVFRDSSSGEMCLSRNKRTGGRVDSILVISKLPVMTRLDKTLSPGYDYREELSKAFFGKDKRTMLMDLDGLTTDYVDNIYQQYFDDMPGGRTVFSTDGYFKNAVSDQQLIELLVRTVRREGVFTGLKLTESERFIELINDGDFYRKVGLHQKIAEYYDKDLWFSGGYATLLKFINSFKGAWKFNSNVALELLAYYERLVRDERGLA